MLNNVQVVTADLNDYPLPIYSPDSEKEKGFPTELLAFDDLLSEADGIVMSMAEYNGNYTAVFKNPFDWLSRIDMRTVWKNKPILLLGASPGGRGAKNVLQITEQMLPRFGGQLISTFSLPLFHENFKDNELINKELLNQLQSKVEQFNRAI